MSPRYDYRCGEGHTTTLFRAYEERLKPAACTTCGGATVYQFPLTHRQPDGIYSYAPNIGTADDHERRTHAIETGQRIIKREA